MWLVYPAKSRGLVLTNASQVSFMCLGACDLGFKQCTLLAACECGVALLDALVSERNCLRTMIEVLLLLKSSPLLFLSSLDSCEHS